MLNPNEIANKAFEKIRGKGYRPEEVDAFLSQVADEMNDLLADKRELEKKMGILADKLEEYRQDEDSLRSALIGAQKLGDSVVRDAKSKAGSIEEEAAARANLMLENAKREIERQQQGFVRMQREVATFKSKLQLVYKQHLELISSIPVDENLVKATMAAMPKEEPAPAPIPTPAPVYEDPIPEPIPEPVDEYDIPLPVDNRLQYTEQPSYSEEAYAPEPERAPHRESRFGPLKFGKEFDLKREDDKRKK